jgi:hypothetical protein
MKRYIYPVEPSSVFFSKLRVIFRVTIPSKSLDYSHFNTVAKWLEVSTE